MLNSGWTARGVLPAYRRGVAHHSKIDRSSPSWVKKTIRACPLYPRKRTN